MRGRCCPSAAPVRGCSASAGAPPLRPAAGAAARTPRAARARAGTWPPVQVEADQRPDQFGAPHRLESGGARRFRAEADAAEVQYSRGTEEAVVQVGQREPRVRRAVTVKNEVPLCILRE